MSTTTVERKATNVHWHDGEVTRENRAQMLGHKGVTLWFTGLSGSGKSTVAVAVEKALTARGVLSYRLDGDNIRLGINANLGFSAEDRQENIRRVGEISKLFADTGVVVLSSFISPYREDREMVRRMHLEADLPYLEVFVDCALEEAEARDPKGLYKKARAGEIRGFTGIDDPYEAPAAPELHLRTDQMTLEQEVEMILSNLQARGIIA
ncbi:adenylyl-sulfate kinase [Microbulbifer guangxiensis]|uniref:adenylyl-sulfate kinase n=1 Tax=Microbulbifer guangxiensis TaxID=2904249 RepID=UPI001EFFA6C2